MHLNSYSYGKGVKLWLQNGKLLKMYLMAKVPPTIGVCGIDADRGPASLLGGTGFTESFSYFLAVVHVLRLLKIINLLCPHT